ncbi:MAG: Methyltransferase domain protein [Chlorobi bacterium OLB7]|nr:MAG: Methyltransferase domain protein [Chlorobi bacterium OLB7]
MLTQFNNPLFMKWIAKAALQKMFSGIPGGHRLNYAFQRHVTRTLPSSDQDFFDKITIALHHCAVLKHHMAGRELGDLSFYEFGAGWDMLTPLMYVMHGVREQVIADIRLNLKPELINHTLQRLAKHHDTLEQMAGRALQPINPTPITSTADLRSRFGITYRAPMDARATGLDSNSIDVLTTTSVFEHIPAADIPAILSESSRVVKPTGIISFIIDPKDHYWFFDKSITMFNFLKFSDPMWTVVNNSQVYQNRLRYSDYIRLFHEAGLRVDEEKIIAATASELSELKQLHLAPRFQKYSVEDLGVVELRVVLRKNNVDTNRT